jgi:hypothetical protein
MRQLQLIQLYYYVCQCYDKHLCLHFQRQSNNYRPAFTDQEVLTVYLFGIMQKCFTLKDTYSYIQAHWLDWFPALPSYQAFSYRINQLGWQFELLLQELVTQLGDGKQKQLSLVDAMPVILSTRPYKAKVALGLADKGYCATKQLYYHGVKLHCLGFSRTHAMPVAEYIHISPASANDLTVLKQLLPRLRHRNIIADKLYASQQLNKQLADREVEIITPVKLEKKQTMLDAADKLLSSYVSSIRQPIEVFFNWINEKTNLQKASKVRSHKGLWVHCYGRLTAAFFLLVFNS